MVTHLNGYILSEGVAKKNNKGPLLSWSGVWVINKSVCGEFLTTSLPSYRVRLKMYNPLYELWSCVKLWNCVKLAQSCLTLCDPMDCIALQAPLSMGFSRQEYWSGLLYPPPGDLPDPGIKPTSPDFPALQVDSLPLNHQGSPSVAELTPLTPFLYNFENCLCHWWHGCNHRRNINNSKLGCSPYYRTWLFYMLLVSELFHLTTAL